MKEVIYDFPEVNRDYSSQRCYCGGKLYHSQIPCPDMKWRENHPGQSCCVIHYGYICDKCGKIYQ